MNDQLIETEILNSDLIYFNQMQHVFDKKLYSEAAKQKYQLEKRRKFNFESLQKQEQCDSCSQSFKTYLGLFSNKELCEMCLNYVCSNCVHKKDYDLSQEKENENKYGKPVKPNFIQ